jgi:hypothetical protein
MSTAVERKNHTSTLAMRSYPHMDGCPCADQARHFELTPQHQQYLAWRELKSPFRAQSSHD